MATRLSQINALVDGEKKRFNEARDGIYHLVQRNPGLLSGVMRSYAPVDDDGEHLPGESTKVQTRVQSDVLPMLRLSMARLLDLQLMQDTANTEAAADVIVDGRALIKNAPVTYLLFLHKTLIDIRTIVSKIPTLDPADTWTWDENLGVHRSEPVQTVRQKKVPRNHVKAPPTDKHPAQVEVYYEDTKVGTWTTTKLSGAAPASAVRVLEERIAKLIDAVRIARDEANTAPAADRRAGGAVFAWLLDGEAGPKAA